MAGGKPGGEALVGGEVLVDEEVLEGAVVLGVPGVPRVGEVLGGRGFLKRGEVLRLGVGFSFRIVEQLSLSMV